MRELPFQVGQLAESRSFQVGFRGAWFRCKIRGIRKKNGAVAYLLEYIDYPDQKIGWVKVYQKPQKPPGSKSTSKSARRQLMVRPCFPTIYSESEKPDASTISGAIVIVDNAWKVGDMVDWWTDGCYWSGTVTELTEVLENGKVKIDLLPPPMGEGLTYEAFSKDIRPSLDWCPENGWTVPMPMLLEGGKQHPCARLVKPGNSEGVLNMHAANGISKVVQTPISTSFECNSSSQNTESRVDSLEGSISMSTTAMDGIELDVVNTSIINTSSSDNASTSHVGDMSTENVKTGAINNGYDKNYPSKKMRTDKSISLNSMFSNSMEAAILDLEELVNRVKWIRGLLELGMPLSATNQSFWEFVHYAPCKQK